MHCLHTEFEFAVQVIQLIVKIIILLVKSVPESHKCISSSVETDNVYECIILYSLMPDKTGNGYYNNTPIGYTYLLYYYCY